MFAIVLTILIVILVVVSYFFWLHNYSLLKIEKLEGMRYKKNLWKYLYDWECVNSEDNKVVERGEYKK